VKEGRVDRAAVESSRGAPRSASGARRRPGQESCPRRRRPRRGRPSRPRSPTRRPLRRPTGASAGRTLDGPASGRDGSRGGALRRHRGPKIHGKRVPRPIDRDPCRSSLPHHRAYGSKHGGSAGYDINFSADARLSVPGSAVNGSVPSLGTLWASPPPLRVEGQFHLAFLPPRSRVASPTRLSHLPSAGRAPFGPSI
jgi:hypothetical protein